MKTATKTKFMQTEIGMIPEDWKVSTLEQISLEITDGSHFSPKESPEGNKIIATVKDMGYNRFSFKNCKRILDEDFDRLVRDGCSPQRRDILISKDGANCLDLIFVYNQDEKIVVLSSIAIVRLKPGFNSQFYRYYLLSPVVQRIMRQGYVSGSAIPRVVLKDLKKVPVPVLDIDAQDRIANILLSFDEKIELNHQMNTTLEAIGKAVFEHWFIDFEFPNYEGKPYRSSGGAMVYREELGKDIPKGWKIGEYSDLVEVTTGKGLKREELVEDGQFPVMGANGELGRTDRFLSCADLILTGRVGTLGTVYIVRDKVWISDNVLISRVKSKENFYYSYYTMRSFDFESLNRGSTQPLITQTDLKAQTCLIPDQTILVLFNVELSSIFDEIHANTLQNMNMSQIRDALLPNLMSGKIRVPVEAR